MKLSWAIPFALAISGVLPAVAQDELPAKTIRSVLAESAKEKNAVTVWIANNKDSAYYKNDTVQFFNNINARIDCLYVEWEMDRRQRMDLSQVNNCREPGIQSLIWAEQNLSIRVSDNGKSPRLTLRGNGKDVDVFEVIELKELVLGEGGDSARRLTLRRVHPTQ